MLTRSQTQEEVVSNTKVQQRQPNRRPVTKSQLRQVQVQGSSTEEHQRPRKRSSKRQSLFLKMKQRYPVRKSCKKLLPLPSKFQYFKHVTSGSFHVVDFWENYNVKIGCESRGLFTHFTKCAQGIQDRTETHGTVKGFTSRFSKSGYCVKYF